MTEQPENPTGESGPAWVPSDPEKAEPAEGGEPTAVHPPVDPTVSMPEPAAAPVPPVPPPPITPAVEADGAGTASAANDRPEIAIGAAFAGGFAIAMILKRLAR